MKDLRDKTCWLIGASEGLGRELALALSEQGVRLILSARNTARLEELRDQIRDATPLPMDVTDCKAVIDASKQTGHIDMVIYNAGAYDPMAAQDWNTDAILKMSEVNYNGAVHVVGAVIPDFLARGQGEIILIGSLAGYRGLPAALGYGPGKAALRSMAETLRYDLRGTGVWVKLVNPGFIKTRLTAKNRFRMPMLMEPAQAAQHVMRAIKRRRFRTDFPVPFSWVIRAIGILPDWIIWRGK
ncbi:SDR family NAD(P)-dependent oxidoreductase [Cochlodiniinecator piscidefendens]|uniref:SDR family NAD(P)-dependent oxidoreductase n=1 Tax=Cochlodiniinecator piscidefendens TaxID=2715756 RepID=UPI00140A3414|nr:SDR family NAD(P)-dependent oxidoreductase [Cochlodiniinecator piscidefendens]